MNPTKESATNGTVLEENAGTGEKAENTDAAAGGEAEAEGSGSAHAAGQESEGSGKSSVAESESEADRKKRLKREADARRMKEKRAAAKIGLVPGDVVPNAPKSRTPKADTGKGKATEKTADFFAKQIYGAHQLAAIFLGEEAMITHDGAAMLGTAVHEVIKEYDFEWIGKWGKWISLGTAVAMVEVPVIMKLRAKQILAQAKPVAQPVSSLPGDAGATAFGVAAGVPN